MFLSKTEVENYVYLSCKLRFLTSRNAHIGNKACHNSINLCMNDTKKFEFF